MLEIGIDSDLVKQVLSGDKTIEGRLGKPKFLKLRVGDEISIREDVWNDNEIISSIPDVATIQITQLLYFESFAEMFSAVDFTQAIPGAKSKAEALETYEKFYSPEDEAEYGVIAVTFSLI